MEVLIETSMEPTEGEAPIDIVHSRHSNTVVRVMDKKFECIACSKVFSRRQHLQKHERTIHGIVAPVDQRKLEIKRLQCDVCQKHFRFPSHINRHKKAVHSIEVVAQTTNIGTSVSLPTKDHQCKICSQLFSTAYNMRRHQKIVHNIDIEVSRKEKIKCTECLVLFAKKSSFNNHFASSHPDIHMKEDKLIFTSEADFTNWKADMEKTTASFYAAYAIKKSSTSRTIHYFECNHSGQYKTRGTGKRHLKVQGSIKMGSECPARIRKQTDSSTNGQVHIEVTFHSTHVGHQCDAGCLFLSKSEKAEIAGKLQAEVPPQHIITDHSYNVSPTKRVSLTKIKDLPIISMTYGIDMTVVRCQSDVLSVDSWVKEMITSDENPILIYKCVGEICDTYPGLNKDDFVLGFMNYVQEQIYKLYGSEVFSIDSTHGTNKYNIQLTSIVVKDNDWEGFPVAFLWSNRQTEDIFIHFFNAIKERIGIMNTKTFMSDDYPALYSAFVAVFGQPKFNLICDWHVKQAWIKNLSTGTHKIENAEKRQAVINALYGMASETDENIFKGLLEANTKKLLEDPDTESFGKYFLSKYGKHPKQWAGCFQIEAHINTNMSVERWHKELKYNSDLLGKAEGRLDKAIHSLIKSLRKKLLHRIATMAKEKLTPKLALLDKTHKAAESVADGIVILETETNYIWTVPSMSQLGAIYSVKRLDISQNHSCNIICEACQACIHEFQCTCNNSTIKFNFCKHIHLVCMKSNFKIRHEPMESSTDCGELVVLIDEVQDYAMEQIVITNELKTGELDEDLQSTRAEICSEILGLLPIVNDTTSKEEFQEIQKSITILKYQLEAMSQKSTVLPPIINKNGPFHKES